MKQLLSAFSRKCVWCLEQNLEVSLYGKEKREILSKRTDEKLPPRDTARKVVSRL
jgi:hypothetical protein